MISIYTPKEWSSLFSCPSLMIDDEGRIWSANEYNKILFGSPSGRIDRKAGRIYGADLGYGFSSQPIAYLEEKNGVIEIRDARAGVFSAPMLYMKDDQIYTAKQYTSIFGAPSGYIRRDEKSGREEPKAEERREEKTREEKREPINTPGAQLRKKLGLVCGGMLAVYCVAQGLMLTMPWLRWAVPLGLSAVLGYKAFVNPGTRGNRLYRAAFGIAAGFTVLMTMLALAL